MVSRISSVTKVRWRWSMIYRPGGIIYLCFMTREWWLSGNKGKLEPVIDRDPKSSEYKELHWDIWDDSQPSGGHLRKYWSQTPVVEILLQHAKKTCEPDRTVIRQRMKVSDTHVNESNRFILFTKSLNQLNSVFVILQSTLQFSSVALSH